MEVRIYGVRGSIPTPGQTTLRYGGNTPCVAVRLADGDWLVLDAGTGIRAFGRDLLAQGMPDRPVRLLLSHQHYDHVIGLPFFQPMYQRGFHLQVFPVLSGYPVARPPVLFDGVHTPVHHADLPSRLEYVQAEGDVWQVGSATVTRLALNHPGGCQGFRITDADGASLTYLTDDELEPPGTPRSSRSQQAAFAAGTGLLFVDAQYIAADLPHKVGWGHSTLPQALELAREAAARTTLLFSHDPDRTDDQVDELQVKAAAFAADNGLGPILAAAEGMRFTVRPDGVERVA